MELTSVTRHSKTIPFRVGPALGSPNCSRKRHEVADPPNVARACDASFLTSALSSMFESPISRRFALDSTAGDKTLLPVEAPAPAAVARVVLLSLSLCRSGIIKVFASRIPEVPLCLEPLKLIALSVPLGIPPEAASLTPAPIRPSPPSPRTRPSPPPPSSTPRPPPPPISVIPLSFPLAPASEIKVGGCSWGSRDGTGEVFAAAALGEAPAATTPRRSFSPDTRTCFFKH